MNPDLTILTKNYLIREVQELEDAYAEALGDETDAATLTALWNRIKMLNNRISETEKDDRKILLNE